MTTSENVAVMNQEGGIRATAALMVIGVDATQGIALDELFGRESKVIRTTRKTTRQTRVTDATKESALVEGGLEEEEEDVVVPSKSMRGAGLCRGKLCINLWAMIWLWSATIVDYFVINIYLKYIPGSEYLNQTIAGISEIAAHIIVGYAITKFTPKYTFVIGYIIAALGGAALIF